MEVISSIYNSGYNIKRLFLGEQELKLAYLGEQIVFNEVIDDLNYVLYEFYKGKAISNTIEAPVKRAILKGSTKYRDIDTGDILDTFDETKNLELVSVKMPVLTTSNEDGTKTNILTVNEEVELRRIGDVRDELNLLTCELTRRIEEAVLSGSSDEGWSYNTDRGTVVSILAGNIIGTKNGASVLCDKFVTLNDNSIRDKELIRLSETSGKLIVHILKERIGGGPNETKDKYLSLFKTWLSNNPITVQYRLGTESIKTVDLTIVDQDGKTINKLNSFNGTTHVSTEVAENSIYPTIAIEVATE